jgi:glycine/D-amino acid oxidase-like deaminating enzyme
MPRYFFDTHDGGTVKDDTGTEFPDLDAVRKEAMRLLPDIARDEVPRDGDHRTFVVLVTDEDGRPVYSATLSYTGLWLSR